jgi:hypothetical protein
MKPEHYNDEKAAERVFLNPLRVEEELAKNPSWMLYYGAQAAKWQAIADVKRIEAKERRGLLASELEAAGKKTTGVTLEAAQDSDPHYVKLMKHHAQAEEQAREFSNAYNALDKKQFALQAINRRNDRDGALSKPSSFQG